MGKLHKRKYKVLTCKILYSQFVLTVCRLHPQKHHHENLRCHFNHRII